MFLLVLSVEYGYSKENFDKWNVLEFIIFY